ncbi:MAG: hypothetical protein AAGK04_07480 [Planctomycetota bacterium]
MSVVSFPEVIGFNPSEGADLRRRRRRELTEALLERSSRLPDEERALIEAVYREGRPVVEIARLRGESPRPLRRRVRRLVERVMSERFGFVARRVAEWTPNRRRVAEACVLHGCSLREAAERLRLSLHAVRRHSDAVQALFEAERDRRRRA